MAAGDLKGEEAICIKLTLGATATTGQVIALQADGKWDPVTTGMPGKFAVALEGGDDTEEVMACVYGRVEVQATAATIPKGAHVIAGSTGKIVKATAMTALDAPASYVEATVQTELDKIQDPRLLVGTVMEAFGSGETGTLFVGMV
jgi:hypothetical protein